MPPGGATTEAIGLGLHEKWGLSAVFTSNVAMASGFSLAALNDRRLTHPARWVSGTVTNVQITGAGVLALNGANCIALLGTNLSRTARWRVQGAQDAGFTTIHYDTNPGGVGTDVAIFDDTTVSPSYFGSGTDVFYGPIGKTAILVTPNKASVLANYWRVTINDSANTDGYIQVAAMDVSSLWQPTENFEADWERGSDNVGQPPGPSEFPLLKVLRWHKFTFARLSRTELVELMNFLRVFGPNGRLLCIPEPLRPSMFIYDAIWSVVEAQPSFTPAQGLSWKPRHRSATIKFMEVDE